jgi:hypothetical protein
LLWAIVAWVVVILGNCERSFPAVISSQITIQQHYEKRHDFAMEKKAIEFQAFLGFGVPSILEHVEARKALSCLGVVPVISVRSAD